MGKASRRRAQRDARVATDTTILGELSSDPGVVTLLAACVTDQERAYMTRGLIATADIVRHEDGRPVRTANFDRLLIWVARH